MNTFRLLLLSLLLAAIPISGFSYTDDQVVDFGDCYYKVVSGTKLTLSFLGMKPGKTGPLVLPATVTDKYGYVLTIVGAEYNPQYRSAGITSVTLPQTMEFIGGYAFSGASLATINIPKSLKRIERGAWSSLYGAPKFTVDTDNPVFENDANGVLYSKGKTKLICVPSNLPLQGGKYTVNPSVKVISTAAFQSVHGLTKIVLPKYLEKIFDGYPTIAPTNSLAAFEIATGAPHFKVIDGVLFRGDTLVLYPRAKTNTTYTVPTGITGITSYAISSNRWLESINFNQVTNLAKSSIYSASKITTLTLPANLKPYDKDTGEGMVEGCFESCNNLTAYHVMPKNKYFASLGGVLFSTNMKTLYFYPGSKPGTTYTIPTTVEVIAGHAFQGAKNLTSMHIPAKVQRINAEAFRDVQNLKTITFDPNSQLQEIEYYAFRWCSSLKEVTLPKSLPRLNEIFYMCINLETINVPAGSHLKYIRHGAFSTNSKLKAFNFLGDCELEKLERNVFAGLRLLESFNIPKSVKVIESNAFIGCANLKTVKFHSDAEIDKIGAGAFADCGITSINIPKKVVKIDREAFLKCKALTTINITKTTTSISPEAFKYCSNLTEINVDRDNNVYSSNDGCLLSKDKAKLMIFPPGKANDKFTLLPPSITIIGDYAFYDCAKLKNVTIPNKVDSIGIRAFGLCDNLNTITFLCDQMIDPQKINQATNEAAFDADKGLDKKIGKIHINVRKNMLGAYQSNTFYQKFASINPSFNANTEEYIAVSDQAVDLLSTTCADHTFILPKSIEHQGKTYEVSLIGDYAFENAPSSVEEVVVKKNVKYIGAKAFAAKSNKIKSVFFIESQPTKEMLSTTRFRLDETGLNFNEFAPHTKIYVKKSAYQEYKDKWTKTVYNQTTKTEQPSSLDFTSQIDYRITDFHINTKYATFAREFDVDFRDCVSVNGARVAAFVAGSKIETGAGDYGTATSHIRMTSIDRHGGVSNSYAYVPAETGVLLKILDKKNATDNNFYYTIGEKDDVQYNISNSVMCGVVGKPALVQASAAAPIYVMQGGMFRKCTSNLNPFPVHKAYLKLKGGAGAKLILHFDDDDTATGIEEIAAEEAAASNETLYNLNGQRVSNPQKGIYIRQGKKLMVK